MFSAKPDHGCIDPRRPRVVEELVKHIAWPSYVGAKIISVTLLLLYPGLRLALPR